MPVEQEKNSARDFNDLPGMVRQIIASGDSEHATIMIGSFKFTCNKMQSDDIKNIPHQVGQITNIIGSDSIEHYQYAIGIALETAAKLELINRIQLLGDARLNDVIKKHRVDPAELDEHTVKNALARIFLEVKLPVLARVGLFKQTPTKEQHAVFMGLKLIGVDNVKNYSDVHMVSMEMSKHLQPAIQAPRPSSHHNK